MIYIINEHSKKNPIFILKNVIETNGLLCNDFCPYYDDEGFCTLFIRELITPPYRSSFRCYECINLEKI